MSSTNFTVQEHIFDTSYIRGYPRATRDEDDHGLKIHVKRYSPIANARFEPYDVTFIAAHANGVGKELYEPLFDELHDYARKSKKFRIRSIWIADVAWQGQSSVLNEGRLGNDPNWLDHSRDLFMLINHFQKAMPRPLVGLGHSMGGCQIMNLSLLHPRLFTSLLMIDPVIQHGFSLRGNGSPTYLSTFRRDLWPSRKAAAEAFLRNKFYQSWDPRVFELWIKFGLRKVPTEVHPGSDPEKFAKDLKNRKFQRQPLPAASETSPDDGPVTLTTPKHQEVFTFVRSINLEGYPPHPDPNNPSRTTHADAYGAVSSNQAQYRPEPIMVHNQLPHVYPSCLYIFAEHSDLSSEDERKRKMDMTGIGQGGSGGAPEGRVKEVLIPGAGHFVPFEKPQAVAKAMGDFLAVEIPRWRQLEVAESKAWNSVPEQERFMISEERIRVTKQQFEGAMGKAKI